MARRTFFSFHYKNDITRANVVRNNWVTKDKEAAGYTDAAEFEKIKAKGDKAVKSWIDGQLKGTSVTVVLLGEDTSRRPYVRYEVEQSWKRGNGIVGIYIHGIKDFSGNTSKNGDNHFGPIFTNSKDDKKYFFERFKTFDWIADNGYQNLGKWIEAAAKEVNR